MSTMSIATVGLLVILFVAVLAWSPLARGLVRESVVRPNEPCTFTGTGANVEVHRNEFVENASPPDTVGAGPHFKWALGAVFTITLLALVALVALVFAPANAQVNAASGTCEKAFIFGFSALIGLIGGKAIK